VSHPKAAACSANRWPYSAVASAIHWRPSLRAVAALAKLGGHCGLLLDAPAGTVAAQQQ
jgi:hypothetical protein